jgi:hypothetical protein
MSQSEIVPDSPPPANVDTAIVGTKRCVSCATRRSAVRTARGAASAPGALGPHAVNRCTREIGVRLAFGARRDTILRMVVGDALRLAAIAAHVPARRAAAVDPIVVLRCE